MAIPCGSTSLQTCIDCFADRYGHRFLSQKSKCETSSPFSVSQQQCRISLVGCESEQRSTRTLVNNSRSQISQTDRKSTRLNSSHGYISYAVFCLKKKKKTKSK